MIEIYVDGARCAARGGDQHKENPHPYQSDNWFIWSNGFIDYTQFLNRVKYWPRQG